LAEQGGKFTVGWAIGILNSDRSGFPLSSLLKIESPLAIAIGFLFYSAIGKLWLSIPP